MIPLRWRYKLAHIYLAEILTVILGLGALWFGASILTDPTGYAQLTSFRQAFKLVAPQWWGLTMVILAVAMIALLAHSRVAAAIPTFILGIVWVLWVIPITLSPGFAPSAPIVYSILSAITLVVGLACLVSREQPSG
ncbi:hypothetical protein [Microbacterium sp.]|uniref:hypothetical protein n=1 Tax=Microbacterium sp. TaxID=51671 RepID=UPI003F72FF8E